MADFGNELKEIQRGWLTSETVVQLNLFGDKAFNIWKTTFKGKEFSIKVTTKNLDCYSISEDSQSWSILEVAVSYIWCSFCV